MPTARFSDSRYYLSYSVSAGSQSIPNNTTSVATGLSITKDGSASGWSSNASYWYTGYPTSASSSFTYDFRSSTYLALYSTSTTVGHNSDGTKSFSTSASVNADTPLGSAAIGAFTVTLPTIPRATIPTVTPSSAVTGQPLTINTVPASGGFTHNISYTFGSQSGVIATGAGSSTTWTPPHSLLTEIPNAPSGTLQIKVQTKSGTTDIGSLQTLNVTLTAGANQVPTISTVALAETNTIIQTNIGTGIYVQGRSILRATITAAGIQGSTITAANKKMIVNGVSYADLALIPINKSGTVTATAEVTDSRGRVASKPANITVLPYQPPRLGSGAYTITRANNLYIADPTGNYGYITLHSLADSLENGATEKNQQTIVVSTRQRGTTTWVTRRVVNGGLAFNGQINLDGTDGYGGGAIFDGDKSYDILIQVYDKTEVYPPVGTNKTPIHIEEVLPTTKVALDIYGSRLGIGKMVEDGTLDVLGDTYTSGNFYGGPAKKLVLLRGSVDGTDITSGNIPSARLPQANSLARGAAFLATQLQTEQGIETNSYVSPSTLRKVLGRDGVKIPIEKILCIAYSDYNNAVGFEDRIEATVLPKGPVILSGLVTLYSGATPGVTFARIDPAYAPEYETVLPVENGDLARSIVIEPNGDISMGPGSIINYLSFDGVAYIPKGVGSWTSATMYGSKFEAYDVAKYGPPSYWKDTYGFTWFRGSVRIKTSTTVDNDIVFTFPSGLGCPTDYIEYHVRAVSGNGNGTFGIRETSIIWKQGSDLNTVGAVHHISGIVIPTQNALTLNPGILITHWHNAWKDYSASYPPGRVIRRPDGLCVSSGLLNAGTIGTASFMIPDLMYAPQEYTKILASVTSTGRGRIDLFGRRHPDNARRSRMIPQQGSNGWFSLDGKVWVR